MLKETGHLKNERRIRVRSDFALPKPDAHGALREALGEVPWEGRAGEVRAQEFYDSEEEYDPVLRWHLRM